MAHSPHQFLNIAERVKLDGFHCHAILGTEYCATLWRWSQTSRMKMRFGRLGARDAAGSSRLSENCAMAGSRQPLALPAPSSGILIAGPLPTRSHSNLFRAFRTGEQVHATRSPIAVTML